MQRYVALLEKSKGKFQVSLLKKKPSAAAKKKVLALASDEDMLALGAASSTGCPAAACSSPTSI